MGALFSETWSAQHDHTQCSNNCGDSRKCYKNCMKSRKFTNAGECWDQCSTKSNQCYYGCLSKEEQFTQASSKNPNDVYIQGKLLASATDCRASIQDLTRIPRYRIV